MAQKPNQPEFFNNDFTAQASETFKMFAAWQWRAAQAMMDQSFKLTQSLMDITHETAKSTLHAGDGVRKDFTAMTEKMHTP